MIKLCLIQLLDYEAQKHLKKKRKLECKECPIKESCAKWVKDNETSDKN